MGFVVRSLSTKFKLVSIALIVVAGIGAYLASLSPVLLGGVFDGITTGRIASVEAGAQVLLIFGAVLLSTELIAIARRNAVDVLAANYEADLRAKGLAKTLRAPIDYIRGDGTIAAELNHRIDKAIEGASQLLKLTTNELFSAVLIGVFMIVQTVLSAPLEMIGVLIGYIVLSILLSLLQIRSQQGIREQIISQKAGFAGSMTQSLNCLEFIRVKNAEEYELRRQKPAIGLICSTESKHHLSMGRYDAAKQATKVIALTALILVGLIQVSVSAMSGGAVVMVVLLFQGLTKPIEDVYRFLDEIASATVKVKKLDEIFAQSDDPVFAERGAIEFFTADGIEVEDLQVLAPGDPTNTIANVRHAKLNSYGIQGIEGPSGSGKSSLIRAILGYYPYRGTVRVFGIPRENIDKAQMARLVDYTPQASFVFAGTVRENLAYGLEHPPTDEEMHDALGKACLLDDLSRKGNGDVLGMRLSENGDNLSGGERGRLMIARAFLRTSRLFVFDEPTKELDATTTARVIKNLTSYSEEIGAGLAIISHEADVMGTCTEFIQVTKANERLAA